MYRYTSPIGLLVICAYALGCSDSDPRGSIETGANAGEPQESGIEGGAGKDVLAELVERAESGDAEARYDLGSLYEREQDYESARV